jgi:para-nitrobenzyl esterase
MVWIHGGGNSGGSASTYDGGHLATAQHVVVVTTQYRLGPLGWLRHRALRAETQDPLEQSGNFATLDLIRALEWVRDNAEAFGGDPNNVTIFGESAGGSNVMTLLVAKPAAGLFHRAILESHAMRPTPADEAEAFADALPKGAVSSSNEMLIGLLARDGRATGRNALKEAAAKMSEAELAAYLRSKTPAEILSFYPRILNLIVAPAVFADGAVLPLEEWNDVLARPEGWNRVPVLLGTNRDEFKLFMLTDPRYTWNLFGLLPRYRDEDQYEAVADATSRSWKVFGADAPAAAMLKSGEPDVFVYRFDWRREPRMLGSDFSGLIGAAHAMEIPFVFGHFDLGFLTAQLFDDENRDERLQLSDAMMSYWGTFARDGHPGGAWTPAPDTMLLDAVSSGGQRMSSQTETLDKVIGAVLTDPRLKSPKDRCEVFHDLVAFRQVGPAQTYERMSRGTCGAYPYDGYPWK